MEFEIDEVRKLIQGKFDFRVCLDCNGKGIELCDGEFGFVVASGCIPKDRDPLYFYWDQCESCNGLGGVIRFDE